MSEQQGIDDGTESGGRRARLRERLGSRPRVRSAALVGSGLVAGGILAGAVTAGAADGGSGGSASGEDARGTVEEALTGDTADQVEEAVLAEYPDAEIERLETDGDGVYEAHVVTADGEELTVELDEEFAVTGTEEVRPGAGGRRGSPTPR